MNPSITKYSFAFLFFAILTTPSFPESPPLTGQHPYHLDVTTPKKIQGGYLLFLPKDYGKDKKLWPTILFLHGAGERGDDLGILGRIALPMVLEERDDFPFIVISPQCPKGQGGPTIFSSLCSGISSPDTGWTLTVFISPV